MHSKWQKGEKFPSRNWERRENKGLCNLPSIETFKNFYSNYKLSKFSDFSHNNWGSFNSASVIFLLALLSQSWFAAVDPPGKINNFGSTTVISSRRSLLVFSQFNYQPLSENKRLFLVPASTGSCMAAPLGSQPITAQKCAVVLDGSLTLQGIDTCSGLETIVIDKPLIESFNETIATYSTCVARIIWHFPAREQVVVWFLW